MKKNPNNRLEYARVARPTRKSEALFARGSAGALGISMELDDRDKVWNRAALEAGGANPLEGDKALAALLAVHGMIMNGGVDNALEVLPPSEVAAGIAACRYFGLAEAAAVLETASAANLGWERFNSRYAALIPADDTIVEAFHRKHRASPEAFAPSGSANA